ncbi:hypothetical protein [Sphingobacterium sp. JUb56]|uniref:hypothetical protein n=1 Tax=Sphingobacterium sp. JUb56 TaxID=2587145 RepID=UPI0016153E8D|nr:hypothetical protein [Sphingobacterium sp. JUb56]MBB2954285.1 hypothetical protein [Sphingobacterium sp. JUb56]
MKKNIFYTIFCALITLGACKRDDFWNQTTEVNRGTISGILTNTDDNSAFKGVKILFERQTKGDGSRTFVDTVATDAQGSFKYEVPYPNKVKVSIRDTGRYHLDETYVELTEKKDYPIHLKSFPRFGESSIEVLLQDENNQPVEGARIALLVRESANESYSVVDTIHTSVTGKVLFDKIAFPVQYKVRIAERGAAYDLDSLEARLLSKDKDQQVLSTRKKFGQGDLTLKANYFYSQKIADFESVTYKYRSILEDDFGQEQTVRLTSSGELLLPKLNYPGTLILTSNADTKLPFHGLRLELEEKDFLGTFKVEFKDVKPRYSVPNFNNLKVSTLNLGTINAKGAQAVTMDNDGNLYIADGTLNQLIKRDVYGHSIVVAGSGAAGSIDGAALSATFNGLWSVALDSSGNIYTVDAANVSGAHKVRKISKNTNGEYVVSTLAGSGSAGGDNANGTAATFNRPTGLVFDKFRNCLYVSEWLGNRVRKIDLATSSVSTLVGSGVAGLTEGIGIVAQVNYAHALSLSSDGAYLYITHFNGAGLSRVRLSDNYQEVMTKSLNQPRGVFVTSDHQVVVSNSGAHKLVLLSQLASNSNSVLTTIAGTTAGTSDGDALSAKFNFPFGMYYDQWTGNWYIATSSNGAGAGSVRVMRSADLD